MSTRVGKRYRHYKGGEYEIVTVGRLEADPTVECVVYRMLYETADFPYGTVWIRPRKNFEEYVEQDGIMVERFKEVG